MKSVFIWELHLNLRKNLMKCCTGSTTLHGVANWALRKLDEEYLESFEVWCWRRMEKINLADRMREEKVEEERNIIHTRK
jgi:hypothetical protein